MNSTIRDQNKDQNRDLSFKTKNSFSYDELIGCGQGELFGPGNAKLPAPPMLMMDRIVEINSTKGSYEKGQVLAELDIRPDLWFFACHFKDDPVMPGCLGLDALWQMLGFYLGWLGHPGRGRALGAGEIKFTNQVLTNSKIVRYQIDVKRTLEKKLFIAIGDGKMFVDDVLAYECNDLKVGLFQTP